MSTDIQPITMPGVHDRFLTFFTRLVGEADARRGVLRILDAGTGHGALAQRLHEQGFQVAACDLFPERFRYAPVEFRQADLTQHLPYADASFDVVIAIEVMEHLLDHLTFVRECHRVLKPGGRLVISTPNVLSLKSRVRFLFSGFFYSFKPLDPDNADGLQHVASLTMDQLGYLARRAGLVVETVAADRYQLTSRWLLWLVPLVYAYTRLAGLPYRLHNTKALLLGRILFIVFRKGRSN